MERIRQKIGRIREQLQFIRSIKDECETRFVADPLYRGALLHHLYLVSDGCIVLAESVIKARGLRAAQSYAEAFDILGENNVLERAFAYDFARIASFRNFLAHDYEKIDPLFICRQILAKLDDIDSFIQQVNAALGLEL